jgi:hypothetical protein
MGDRADVPETWRTPEQAAVAKHDGLAPAEPPLVVAGYGAGVLSGLA